MRTTFSCLAVSAMLAMPAAAAAQDKLKEGDIVWAEWKTNAWYHGKIAKVAGNDYHIDFDDGDKNIVDAGRIALDKAPKKDDVKAGTRVLAKFQQKNFFPGKIAAIAD